MIEFILTTLLAFSPPQPVFESDVEKVKAAQKACRDSDGVFHISQAQGGWMIICNQKDKNHEET